MTMTILLISYNDIQRDGRLNEIKRVLEHLGTVYMISKTLATNDNNYKEGYLYKYCGSSYLGFILFCKKVVLELGSLDMIVADNRNCIIPALVCKKLCSCKYTLYDARELYLLSESTTIRSKIGCIIEKLFVRKFDVITCANQLRADYMVNLYSLDNKPISFENIRRLEYSDLSESECKEKFGSLFSDGSFINIVTTSGEALIRRADAVVSAVAKLGQDYRLFVIGYEDSKGHKKIEEICKQYNWHNIVRYKWLTKSELKFVISHCDIGIVNYSFQNINNKLCAPGKIYEFAFEGIPVVTTSNPTLIQFCNEYGIGVVDDMFYEGIRTVLGRYDLYKERASLFAEQVNISKRAQEVAEQIAVRIEDL